MTDETLRDETLRYDIWVEEALRSVIKKTLTHVSEHGLPGDHHFYISFQTQAVGVAIPGHLRAQHPNDMTIVMQYQYDDLVIEDDFFSVVLSFGGKKEQLVIPYTAVISFADPSVNFALQLKMMQMDDDVDVDVDAGDDADIVELENYDAAHLEYFEATRANSDVPNAGQKNDGDADGDDDDDKKSGEVIALDAFRKK